MTAPVLAYATQYDTCPYCRHQTIRRDAAAVVDNVAVRLPADPRPRNEPAGSRVERKVILLVCGACCRLSRRDHNGDPRALTGLERQLLSGVPELDRCVADAMASAARRAS